MKKTIMNGDMKLVPATKPSDNSVLVVDRENYLSAMLLLSSGNATSSNTVLAKIQHGDEDDGSDMADYSPLGSVIQSEKLILANTSVNLKVDLSGAKKYIRIALVTAGSAPTSMAQFLLADGQYGENFNE